MRGTLSPLEFQILKAQLRELREMHWDEYEELDRRAFERLGRSLEQHIIDKLGSALAECLLNDQPDDMLPCEDDD